MTTQPGQAPNADQGPFEKFLRRLDPDRDRAGEKYEDLRRRLVRYFVHKGCRDPHELFETTIDRAVRKLESEPGDANPLAYCFGVARLVWLESLKDPSLDPIEDLDIPAPQADEPNASEEELKCLEICLAKFSQAERDLFRSYHEDDGRARILKRKQLARENGGNNILRIRIFRIKTRLEDCIGNCLNRAVN